MQVDIGELRKAVKSILPLASESYRGYGTGVFTVLHNSMWLVTGSFNGKLAGARVCDEIDENLVGKYFSITDLHQFLTATFTSDNVNAVFDSKKNRIVFKIRRNTRSFSYDDVADVSKFIELPALSSSMQITLGDLELVRAVASASHDDPVHNLSGVWVRGQGEIEFIATDGFIIAYAAIKNELLKNFEALIPASFLSYVGKIYWDGYPRMHISDRKITFFSDEYFAISALLSSEKYPGEQIVGFYSSLELEEEGIVDVLDFVDKIGVLAGVDKRDTGVSAVVFEFDDERGDLRLSAKSKQQNGEAEFFVPAYGLTHKIILNGNLAKKVGMLLRNLNSVTIRFSPVEEHNLMVLRPPDGNITIGLTKMAF